ncbi:hypothetical protein ACM66B_003539 [Microbotryomycetes sp. NB124-2]
MAPAPKSSLAGVTPLMPKDSQRSSKTGKQSTRAQASGETVAQKVTALVASLPPATNPATANLNPLADLVSLFERLPVTHQAVVSSATVDERERLELNRQHVHLAVHSLKHVFTALINAGRLYGKLKRHPTAAAGGDVVVANGTRKRPSDQAASDEPESVKAVRQWIQAQYSAFLAQAATVAIEHWDANVRVSAFTAIMNLLRTESQFMTSLHPTKQAQFAASTLRHVVNALLAPGASEVPTDVRDEWTKYWTRYDDVRYFFLQETTDFLAKTEARRLNEGLVSRVIDQFESLTTMPTVASELNEWWCSKPLPLKSAKSNGKKRKLSSAADDDERPNDGSTGIFDSSSSESEGEELQERSRKPKKLLPPLLQLSAHRRAFQDCILALLALPLSEDSSKRLLSMLHRQILPHMVDPKRLMDWLVDCADAGGSIAILALNGLFTLITKHNLEYPDFYTKLYALLDRDVLHVRYRPRFFRLLLVFMSSTHLPAALVASFVKRLARLSLSAPPAAAVTIVPFVYNMLKNHPSCMAMIHRAGDEESDAFLPNETDPNNTQAISSSLWEIAALQQHYLASVSGLAKIFNEVMNKQSYSMEDFLDHSYATMFNSEVTRVVTRAPALAPVPKRQPIGDSFFPSRETALSYVAAKDAPVAEAVATEGEEAPEVVPEAHDGPVDIATSLWSF